MAETNPAAASAPQPRRDHHHPVIRAILIGWMPPIHRSVAMLLLSWLAPFIIMAVGREAKRWLPQLWPSLEPFNIWPWVSLQLVLVLFWLIYEIWYTTHRNTSGGQLQADVAGDMLVAFAMIAYIGYNIGSSSPLSWWFFAPCAGAVVDVFQSAVLGINNALEKPFVSAKGSS